MIGAFLAVAIVLLALAGYLLYARLHKPLADPDYFMPILTSSASNWADPTSEQGELKRPMRQIRHLDLEQIRSAGL